MLEKPLYRFARKSWLHVFILSGILIYFITAPIWYYRWFVVEGKALAPSYLPPQTTEFKGNIDKIVPYDKKGAYQVIAWGFLTDEGIPLTKEYERKVALISPSNLYFFSITPMQRNDVRDVFRYTGIEDKQLQMTGYTLNISIYSLTPDTYHVLLIFQKENNEAVYADTNQCIRRTPNKLLLVDCQ